MSLKPGIGLAAKRRKKRKIKELCLCARLQVRLQDEPPLKHSISPTLCFCVSCAFLRQFSRSVFAPLRLCVKSCVAFTFVEILAALVFLAILVPAVIEGITLSSRASVLAERSAVAAELAQNKLNELTLSDTWATVGSGGDFGTDWPGYRWESTQSTWDMDTMTLLAVKVYFTVQGHEQSLGLSTLVSSTTTSITTTTGTK